MSLWLLLQFIYVSLLSEHPQSKNSLFATACVKKVQYKTVAAEPEILYFFFTHLSFLAKNLAPLLTMQLDPPRGWRFACVLQIVANTASSHLTPAEVRSNLQRSTHSVTSLEAMYFWRYRKLYTTFDTFAVVLLKTL